MTHCGHHRRSHSDWEDIGEAAEDFARHVARDAQRFAERVAGHATELARDFAREWRGRHRRGADEQPLGEDVRAVLQEVRTFVTEVVDGVDDLIDRVLQREPDAPGEGWERMVTSREVACAGCGRQIAAGEECHLRRRADAREFRCLACGPIPASPPPGPAPGPTSS